MSMNRNCHIIVYSITPKMLDLRPLHVAVAANGLVMLRYGITKASFRKCLQNKFSNHKISVQTRTHIVIRQIREYLQGTRKQFLLDLDLLHCSPFQRLVLDEVMRIPYGETTTYGAIAKSIGNPKASRAIGGALAHNPLPIVVPCHRVICSNGSIGGYLGSPQHNTKIHLLKLEGIYADKYKITAKR